MSTTIDTVFEKASGPLFHHVMRQWEEENPTAEPFNSVVYYAKQLFIPGEAPHAQGRQRALSRIGSLCDGTKVSEEREIKIQERNG